MRGGDEELRASKAQEVERARIAAEEQASRAAAERENLSDQLAAQAAEAAAAKGEKAKVEAEMRLVLKAMDAQKQAATRNLSQLSKICHDWSSVANTP